MRFKSVGNKADLAAVVIRNNDPNSTVIKTGAPTFFIDNATLRGLDVAAADGLAAANQGGFAGFNVSQPLNVGDFGEAMVFGYYDYARIFLSSRATTTDSWASYAAIVLGDIMAFITGSGIQGVSRSGAGSATNLGWWVRAAQTLASATTLASSVGGASTLVVGNSTALMTLLRVQVRAM